jgi:serine/threonine protein kinase
VREAQVLAALTAEPNPNIPSIFEVGEYQGLTYLTREHVEGNSLERLTKSGAIGLLQGIDIVGKVAGVVQQVHAEGLAHRNLQPSNVLIDTGGTVKLIGFGQVGFLRSSNRLPPGASGTPVDVDILGLQGLLRWLHATLRHPFPTSLEEIQQTSSAASALEYKEVLERYLQQKRST